MSCTPVKNICGILNVGPTTAKIFMTVGSGVGCKCAANSCLCQDRLTAENTYINIRRDGPKYGPSFGCCGNPAHRVENCPILPGDLSFPFPTFIVPCPDPVAPPFVNSSGSWFYKFPPFVKYPLFSKSGSELCFFLDSIFYNVPRGRYVADLFVNNVYCDSLRLKYDNSCRISASRAQKFTSNPCADANPAKECPTDSCA